MEKIPTPSITPEQYEALVVKAQQGTISKTERAAMRKARKILNWKNT